MLTRTPALEGTTATFNGMFTAPARNVTPPATASGTPAGVRFGPRPHSAPSLVRHTTSQLTLALATLCSSPPSNTAHFVVMVRSSPLLYDCFSNCHPNCEIIDPTSICLSSFNFWTTPSLSDV